MHDTHAFAPFYKVSAPSGSPSAQTGTLWPSVTVSATAGGANASAVLYNQNGAGNQVQIANTSTSGWTYVNFGVFGNVTAATVAASYPVGPGASVVVTVDPEVNGASVIMGAGLGAANVIFTRGNGV